MSPRHLCRKSSNVFNLASMTEEYPRAASPVSSLRGYKTLSDDAIIQNYLSDGRDLGKNQNNIANAVNIPSNGTAGASDDNKEEKAEENKEKKNEHPPVGFFTLFRYSSATDKLLISIGCLIALIAGAAMPTIVVLFGKIVNGFVDNQRGPTTLTPTNVDNESTTYFTVSKSYSTVRPTNSTSNITDNSLENIAVLCQYLCIVGGTIFILNYIMVSCFSVAAASQAFRIRCLFMQSVLKQNIGWFDTNETGDFASRITADLVRIQDGIGEKVGMCIAFISTTILSLICALYYGWKLTLVMLSVMPIMTIAMAIITKIQSSVSGDELSSYGAAGAVAEEVLSSIKTVVAFGGEKKEIDRYDKKLVPARKKGIRRGLLTSIGSGLFWLIIYGSYALAFWYGVKLIIESRNQGKADYDPSVLIIVFFNVMMGAMGIGQTAPYFEAFAIARGAAGKIFKIIERSPPIDSSSPEGLILPSLEGDIKLEDVHFSYPARSDVPVLKGLTLSADPGETVALVGPSGCGKSTVIQLIQRFYDPLSGSVFVDQNDVRDLNLGWLRDNIGVVGQEPVLFSTTIAENISYGKKGATQEEIEKAARSANAHDFIMGLPKKYNTLVGERGTQLSGGQKQRIAIARALVRNPKVLLLDEATSALDTESESIVQAALDKARLGRTTLIVAHRLSTIRTADKIIVISDGIVKETGTHNELMEQNGLYYQLVTTQVGDEENFENVIQNHIHFRPEFERQVSVISSGSYTSEDFLPRASRTFSRTFSFTNVKVHTVDEEEEDKNANPSQIRLLQISAPEWPFLVIGCISAFLMGLSIPVYGILFGEILGVLAEPNDEKIMKDIEFYSILFIAMGVGAGTAIFLQTFMFSVAGERLTSRLRKLAFTAMITQDMSWFDHPKNNTGSLCSRLSSDASSVQGATGSRMGTLFQSLSTLMCAIIIGIYFNWKLGLVVLAFIPLVLLATFFESRIISGHMLNEKSATELASKIAIEAIENVRTVASLHQEETFYIQFKSALIKPFKKFTKNSHVRGLTYGFAQSIPSFAYASAMYYGSILVKDGDLNYADLFKVVEAIILGTMMIGQAVAFAPDYQKARVAAVHIFKLLDLRPVIDVFSNDGLHLDESKGNVTFSNVRFNYPSRPEVKVLRSLNLKINPGQTVALVGSSGCGKSTCVQLLERFYDAQHGEVLLDNTDVKELNISWLRSQIGIVSQEPVLFGYSIAENIAYGDNSRSVPMDQIIEAARQANIHTFVSSLPQGYETAVGDRGTQLSGGQKQRIAIARALVRNPKILLLDEATSALDTESEKVVQEALDKASKGRTCIIIAHRLSTIQNADMIVVIRRGRIVEQGTHQELLAKRACYVWASAIWPNIEFHKYIGVRLKVL